MGATMDSEQHRYKHETPKHEAPQQFREETIHIHYYPDAIVMVKGDEDIVQDAIETTLAPETKHPDAERAPVDLPSIGMCLFGLSLVLSCLAFQVYLLFNQPTATVAIIPMSQTVTLSGTLQLGRVLAPITLSQARTIPTTGKGHQDARQASGTVTFYNGLFTRRNRGCRHDLHRLRWGAGGHRSNSHHTGRKPAYVWTGNSVSPCPHSRGKRQYTSV